MKKMGMWWKKIVSIGFVVSIAAISLLLLQPKDEKITLTFGMIAGNQWDVPNDDCYRIIDETIEEFEKEYPNVEVKYDSGILKDDYSEYISENALKETLPDVFMVLQEDFTTFASVGILKDLDGLIKADKSFDPESYYQGSYDAGSYSGKQYALPYESVPTLMFVNKTLLEKEGIQMPENDWDWDDFYEICKQVTKDTDGDGRLNQFGVYHYDWKNAVYSNGGELFDAEGTECKLTDDRIEDALVFTKKIQALSGYQSPTSNDFDMGNIAFRPMQFSEFRAYKPYPWRINKYSNFQWDCIPLPTGTEGENKTEVENLMMGISNQTQHSQIAWQFLKMLTYNQETQKKLFQYSQGISALKAITNSKEVEDILEEDMGEDTVVKVELLNKVMEHQAETYKFRTYTSVEHYIDQEIMELIQEDDGFDEDLLEIKREADKQLNE